MENISKIQKNIFLYLYEFLGTAILSATANLSAVTISSQKATASFGGLVLPFMLISLTIIS